MGIVQDAAEIFSGVALGVTGNLLRRSLYDDAAAAGAVGGPPYPGGEGPLSPPPRRPAKDPLVYFTLCTSRT